MAQCRQCGKQLLEHHSNRRYCNTSCRGKSSYRRRSLGKVAPLVIQVRKCVSCLGPFRPSSPSRKTCCDECRSDAQRQYQYTRELRIPTHRRIKKSVSANIRNQLKKLGMSKSGQCYKDLGLSGHEFMQYLLNHENNADRRFTEANYGDVWEIDHVRPVASFDISDPEQRSLAFHYTNCQPLEKSVNRSKGSIWEGKRHRHAK